MFEMEIGVFLVTAVAIVLGPITSNKLWVNRLNKVCLSSVK
jgi:hypothetical protein